MALLLGLASHADTATYLLFDVIPHEQLNKQRRAYMFYLDLAMRLKRTLVLPRGRLVKKDGAGRFLLDQAEYMRWGELFNVSALAELHPVVELEDFLAEGHEVSLMTKIDHKGCAGGGRGTVDFNGLTGVPVGTFQCKAGLQYNHAALFKLKSTPSLGFSHSVDQMSPQQALPLRAYVKYEKSVYDAAAAFVEAEFGNKPFVALHWRRTDFLQVRRSQPGVLQSAQDLVRHARSLMARARTDLVYLATDSDNADELEYVRSNLKPARYTPSLAAGDLRARTVAANVEIVICAMADQFLGTKTSSFTLAINEERVAIFAKSQESSGEMDTTPSPPATAARPPSNAQPPKGQAAPQAAAAAGKIRGEARPADTRGASPPNVSPIARISALQRYLLFDVIPHEQINKQRRAYMFYLDLAMRLKRTLVLPRGRLVKKDGAGGFLLDQAEYMRWGELFNVSALAKLHPVVELEDFLAEGHEVSLMVQIDHQPCAGGGRGTVDFNGLKGVIVGRFQCSAGLQYDGNALARLDELPSIGFANSVDQMSPQQALPLRAYVKYEKSVYDAAAAFVEAEFGNKPFVALHWRRTDFLQVRRSQPGVLQSAQDLVRHARSLMARARTDLVYLATDSDNADELEYVRSNLKPARYTPSLAAGDLRARTVAANVEIVICAMADQFLGTKTSSFTLAINEERVAIFAKSQESSGEMDRLKMAAPLPPQPRPTQKKDEL